MKKLISSLLLLFLSCKLYAQDVSQELVALRTQEDSMKIVLDSLRGSRNDTGRTFWNKHFKRLVFDALEMSGSFSYPFDSLKSVARLTAPDQAFRIINWNIENDNGTFSYYAYVLIAGNNHQIFELIDQSDRIIEPEDKTLDNKKWYGALYYQIILSGTRGRNEYTLLGWDGNNNSTKKKIIDVMTISRDKLQFGAPVFKNPEGGWKKRVVFEFSSQASLLMHWDAKNEQIVFDHLMPETPAAEGIFEFYFPDGSYDAYKLENEKWIYVNDVDARRGKDKRDKNFIKPEGLPGEE